MKTESAFSRTRVAAMKDILMPIFSILIVLIPIVFICPRVLNYNGLTLLFNMVVPVALAAVGQMFALAIGEIDFSIGSLVSLVTCVVGTLLPARPVLGLLFLVGILGVYALIGAFLYLKKLPSIVVTIGMSFVWTGLALTIQPHPGGNVPLMIQNIMGFRLPMIPLLPVGKTADGSERRRRIDEKIV